MTEARVEVWSDEGHILLTVSGEVDLANYQDVEARINEAVTNQTKVVEVDLTRVGFIDSAGLRVLFGLAGRLDLLQIRLELVAPRASPAQRVIELSGLSALVPVRTDDGAPEA